jgi:hypothetical protein
VHIYGSTPRLIDRSQWEGSTYESANKVGSHPADAAFSTRNGGRPPDAPRSLAESALRNERFGSMLEKIGDPRTSDALMRMGQGNQAGGGTDHAAAFAAYKDSE